MLSGKHKISIDMTVLERQQARIKWLQQQHDYATNCDSIESCSMPAPFQGFFDHESMNGKMLDWKKQPEMYLGNNDFRKYHGLCIVETEHVANTTMDVGQPAVAMRSLEIDHCLSRTSSCQIGVSEAAKVGEVAEMEVAGEKMALMENKQSKPRRSSSMKRKAESFAIEECKDKMITDAEVESKKEKNIAEISADSSKENQKTSVLPKTDYIHVRARRGQATDSHSLAERARREKISKKMKSLQDLVPGCNKITGRAGMLEEIINYVQSLQRQVEFLSMKLAALNPRPEFNIDNVSGKEFPAHVASFPAAISSTIASLPHLQLYSVQQQEATGSGAKALTSPPLLVLEKISSSSAFNHELCLDSFAQVQPFWDSDSQNLQNLVFH